MNGPRYRPRGDRPLRRPPIDSSRLRGPAADPSVEQRIRELDAEREPLSLAEESPASVELVCATNRSTEPVAAMVTRARRYRLWLSYSG